jgi:hypothetical protein
MNNNIYISENTKTFIKHLLLEKGGKSGGPGRFSSQPNMPGSTAAAQPGTAGGAYSYHPSDDPEYFKERKQKGSELDPYILTGRTDFGSEPGDILKHITDMSQGYASIEYLDSMLPAILKGAMALNLLNKPGPARAPSAVNMPTVSTGDPEMDRVLKGIEQKIGKKAPQSAAASGSGRVVSPKEKERIRVNDQNKFIDLTKKFAFNLSSLDPFNPLAGIKLGYELLGGKEILQRTRELGAAQTAGVKSTMGHPSAIGRF